MLGRVLSESVHRVRIDDGQQQSGLRFVHETKRQQKNCLHGHFQTIAHFQSSGCAHFALETISSESFLISFKVSFYKCFNNLISWKLPTESQDRLINIYERNFRLVNLTIY